MFTIDYAISAIEDLAELRLFDRKRIKDKIDEELPHQPEQESRNKKKLPSLKVPWLPIGITRELRVGEFRVFYEVDKEENLVMIQRVRNKPPQKTTEEICNEDLEN